MKSIKIFLLMFLFVSCSSKQTSLEQYLAYPVKFPKKEIKEPNGHYSIFVPKDWKVDSVSDYDMSIFGASFKIDENEDYSQISIIRIDFSRDNDGLKWHYNSAFEKFQDNPKYKLMRFGKTDIFSDKFGYYIQSQIRKNEEVFEFFIEEEKDSLLVSNYFITISTTIGENQIQNISMMLNCLKTFKILDNQP